jgi:choline kinase
VKAVILAAGTASRLRPLTENTPKCLLKIGDKCLLERTIDGLLANGIHDIIIVTGFLHGKIRDFIRQSFPKLKVTFVYNERYASTNNIYSLWLTKTNVGDSDFLLLDSDIYFDKALITALLDSSVPDCLALNRHALGEEEIKVIVDSENKVREISKTCSPEAAAGESIGVEKMSSLYATKLFNELDVMIKDEKLDNVFYELAFERLASKGEMFEAVDTTGIFSMEIDTVDDYMEAQKILTGWI